MKQNFARTLALALTLALTLGLVACGQRVTPQPPEGKLYPSSSH